MNIMKKRMGEAVPAQDMIQEHMSKVKSQPYVGDILDQAENPYL